MGAKALPQEIKSGERFEFGKNWQQFLTVLNEERIAAAEGSLKDALGEERLAGKTFLDVGAGSGLFSLAAMRLGAQRVHSFDYDPQSVACAAELKRRYFPLAASWTIARANVLEEDTVRSLGQWDIVYAWGVLHHTGAMWRALDNVAMLPKPGGVLFVSIYNDQGITSRLWKRIKSIYNRNYLTRWAVITSFIPYFALRSLVSDLVRRLNPSLGSYGYKQARGMSRLHDWLDWLGGLPFETATTEQVFAFYRGLGFELEWLSTCGGKSGCNEFVWRKL